MQKTQIYMVFAVNAIVWCVIVLLLVPDIGLKSGLIISAGMMMTLIAPVIVVNIVISRMKSENVGAVDELKSAETELESLRSRFAEVTTMDELTGCANRRHFMELVVQHMAMSDRGSYDFTVALTQVDQFASIVERQGLARGHEVLQLFSRIVKTAMREVDALARMESDKFALILSGCSEADALPIINRINQLISQIQVNDQDDTRITSSGGITCFHGTESAEELIEHAEEALQFAVEQGRDRVAGYNYTDPAADS